MISRIIERPLRQVAKVVTRELEKESIVVFDEGHNIDNICIEAFTVALDRNQLAAAARSVTRLERDVAEALHYITLRYVRLHYLERDARRERDVAEARRGAARWRGGEGARDRSAQRARRCRRPQILTHDTT